jgi:anthranilate/para-aminobenzoate synthase component I
MKNLLRNKIITKIVDWQEPLDIASKIADNHFENWFFLYSALHLQNANSKSYIAIFEKNKFVGEKLSDFEKIFAQNDNNKMWFGGFSYEALSQFDFYQESALKKSYINKIPTIFFSNFELVLEFNHQKKILKIKTTNLDYYKKILNFKSVKNPEVKNPEVKKINSNFTNHSYKNSIINIKKMISEGDFFQANLTRKFYGQFNEKPNQIQSFNWFLELMNHSPANYSTFINFDKNFIISSSPELFLKVQNNKILSRPIKGTIARGINSKQDRENKKYLKNSHKEIAENLMIVDLMRNDFSRFCEPKSVKVDKLFKITNYKTIFHLSSQIRGLISKNFNIFDAIRNCFPAGSMTGAPKIKVVEVLQNLEKMPRGIYSGALGFFDGYSQMNFSVVIRTLIINDNKFEFQVGGGITFDSQPQKELEETFAKATGILKVLNIAQEKLLNL